MLAISGVCAMIAIAETNSLSFVTQKRWTNAGMLCGMSQDEGEEEYQGDNREE